VPTPADIIFFFLDARLEILGGDIRGGWKMTDGDAGSELRRAIEASEDWASKGPVRK